ncbi:MAG TPA: hypothetical protein VFS16_12410 [Acidimicrobiia bacterium]|nr:hypothetical protein [Acidimicrobiia bacterium]
MAAIVVVVVGGAVVTVDGMAGSRMVGMSNEASCVRGAWAVDTRNSPPTRSMMKAAGLVRRKVLPTFI